MYENKILTLKSFIYHKAFEANSEILLKKIKRKENDNRFFFSLSKLIMGKMRRDDRNVIKDIQWLLSTWHLKSDDLFVIFLFCHLLTVWPWESY